MKVERARSDCFKKEKKLMTTQLIRYLEANPILYAKTPRYANTNRTQSQSQSQYTQFEGLHNIHFADLALLVDLALGASYWISDPPTLRPDLFIESRQPLAAVDSPVGQNYWVVLDYALGVVCIWDVARQLVELRATYRTHCCGR